MKKDEKLKIAEKARVYRAINRLTQAELGALTKTSQRVVSYLETESVEKLSAETCQKIREIVCG